MGRLWIILLVIWYRAFTMAKTEQINENFNNSADLLNLRIFDENKSNDPNEKKYIQKIQDYRVKKEILINNETQRNKRSYPISNNEQNSNLQDETVSTIISDKNNFEEKLNTLDDELMRLQVQKAIQQKLTNSILSLLYKQIDPEYIIECLYGINKRKFSAWGGKRTISNDALINNHLIQCLNENYLDNFEDKYNKDSINNLLSGKRSSEDQLTPKRLPFRAWGGKRDTTIEGLSPKRLPFKAWGGKRTAEEVIYPIYAVSDDPKIDEVAMMSLFDNYPRLVEKRINRKKTKFHSWGGKRNSDDVNPDNSQEDGYSSNDLNNVVRRWKFNSWGGKRDIEGNPNDNYQDKRTFHSWGGKRGDEYVLDEEEYPLYETDKRTFHSWGGK